MLIGTVFIGICCVVSITQSRSIGQFQGEWLKKLILLIIILGVILFNTGNTYAYRYYYYDSFGYKVGQEWVVLLGFMFYGYDAIEL